MSVGLHWRDLATLAAFMLVAGPLPAQAPMPFSRYLRGTLGFSDEDLRRIRAGAVVTRVLPSRNPEEIALVGVARFDVPSAAFLRAFDNIAGILTGPETRQFGETGNPPSAEQFERYALPDADVDALRQCRVGACKLKLPGDVISAVRELDWSAGAVDDIDAMAEPLSRLMRRWMWDYLATYQRRGDSALVIYDDAPTPLPLHEGFHYLLAESPVVYDYVPRFHHYLERFPRLELPGVQDRWYWAVEEFGLRPLTTLTHVSIYAPPVPTGARPVIALKQIFATHYFHAALKLLVLAEDDAQPQPPGFYLVYLDRSLFDKKLGGLTRRAVTARLEDGLRARLARMQRTIR